MEIRSFIRNHALILILNIFFSPQLFLKAPVNTAELTDLLIQQNHIGSVIKVSWAVVLILIKLVLYPAKFLLIYSK